MTPLKRTVTRRSEELMRDRFKFRRIVITLYPAGFYRPAPRKVPT